MRSLASEELSPNEVARIVGEAIGKPDLEWVVVPEEQMLDQMLEAGLNEFIAKGFIAMQAAQRSGSLYEDFNLHRPKFGKSRLQDLSNDIANIYHNL
jgi:hypothetical protein